MGFEPQIAAILSAVRPDRQTVLFSATFPKAVENLAKKSLRSPLEIIVGGKSSSSTTMPAQFTPDQIINLVQRLKGTCSQFHDGGWWSYELCHMQQFRPFHVDISTDPADLPKYEIRDVSLVGKFDDEIQIIYPKGVYDGEFKKGSITSVKYDAKGAILDVRRSEHDLPDGELYPSEITNFDDANGDGVQ